MQDNLPAVEGVRPTWRPSSRTKIAGHRAGVTLRPILYACWSVCVCVVFAHVRFWSSDYYTNRRRDSGLDAGGRRPSSVLVRRRDARSTRTAPTAPRRVYPAGRSAARTGYRVPATAGLLGARAGRRRRRYGGLPARHTRPAAVLVHPRGLSSEFRVAVGHAVVFSGVFKSARWRDDNATPRRTATWRDDKAAPRTAARSRVHRGLTSNYAVAHCLASA